MASFAGNLIGPSTALPHFWEHTVGGGHATLGLRSDWQCQLKRTHDELGMRHVRFHGMLCDDMGTLIDQDHALLYSFFNADQIVDFLLSIGMKPFVELSFMPSAISSGAQTVFHYRANVSAPRDPAQWAVLIRRLVTHWCQRYGLEEVRQWFFEVWNEPNLTAFGSGKQGDYFELYRYTVQAIKGVDAQLKVGGPATAANAWVGDFIAFCGAEGLAADFITTHHYPTDSFGRPGDDTEAQLSESRRSVLRDEARVARKEAGELPLYYTEWCTSSNPRDPMHDDPYAAAFIVKTVLEANGLVQGYSYWTFSDIFEENYFPSVPFQGGFGLLNIQGIAKPAYRAFEILHGIGTEQLPVSGAHATVDAWLIRGPARATVVLTNFALPRHPIHPEPTSFTLSGAGSGASATIRRIDLEHANAKRRWEQMGKPEYLSAAEVAGLDESSRLSEEPQPFTLTDGTLRVEALMPPQSVAAIEITFSTRMQALEDVTDGALLDRLQRGAFDYFTENTNPSNGLVADTSRPGSPCSIAVVGFALSSYAVAVERGWMARSACAALTLRTLEFFWRSTQGDRPDSTGFRGFYYHFLDMQSGRRVWQCELSVVDTTLLMAGILTAACYFDGVGDEERIRELSDALFRRVDWQWARNGRETVSQGWKPEFGFLHYGWEGYNEATLVYVLGAGSQAHPLPGASFAGWTVTYQWENLLGHDVLYSGPLFTHLFSHAWIDYRGIQDGFMRGRASDYFENTRRTIAVHREYGARNPRGYEGYARDLWGITAGDGPGNHEMRQGRRDRRFFGYMSRGVPFGPDDGTIAPWAMLATLPFNAEAALSGTRHLLKTYPQVCSNDRFSSGFNPSLPVEGAGWLSEGFYGLDQGLLVMMIENHRTGLLWEITRQSPTIRRGLTRAGFTGGWL